MSGMEDETPGAWVEGDGLAIGLSTCWGTRRVAWLRQLTGRDSWDWVGFKVVG
jgi:hypothetical protein